MSPSSTLLQVLTKGVDDRTLEAIRAKQLEKDSGLLGMSKKRLISYPFVGNECRAIAGYGFQIEPFGGAQMLNGAVGRFPKRRIKRLKEGDELMPDEIALIAGVAIATILTVLLI